MVMFKADLSDSEIKKAREMKLKLDAKNNADFMLKLIACCNELQRIKGRNIL